MVLSIPGLLWARYMSLKQGRALVACCLMHVVHSCVFRGIPWAAGFKIDPFWIQTNGTGPGGYGYSAGFAEAVLFIASWGHSLGVKVSSKLKIKSPFGDLLIRCLCVLLGPFIYAATFLFSVVGGLAVADLLRFFFVVDMVPGCRAQENFETFYVMSNGFVIGLQLLGLLDSIGLAIKIALPGGAINLPESSSTPSGSKQPIRGSSIREAAKNPSPTAKFPPVRRHNYYKSTYKAGDR